MSELARPLIDDNQIKLFLSAIDFEAYFSDRSNLERVFGAGNEIDVAFAQAVTLIKEANYDLIDVVTNNTLESEKYRSYPYKTDEKRAELKEKIIQQLFSQVRPDNDDDIKFGYGGMLPKSSFISSDRKAFIIIGLPASGKSGIAAKVSDFYNAILIDSDFAKRKIPEFIKGNGATLVHKESKIIKDEVMRASICLGLNFVLPIIGNEYIDVVDIILNLKRHKYKVHIILVELDRVKATQRAFNRFIQTRRYIPLSKILDEYSNGPSLTFYKLLVNQPTLPMALINTDVSLSERPQISVNHNFAEIRKII